MVAVVVVVVWVVVVLVSDVVVWVAVAVVVVVVVVVALVLQSPNALDSFLPPHSPNTKHRGSHFPPSAKVVPVRVRATGWE